MTAPNLAYKPSIEPLEVAVSTGWDLKQRSKVGGKVRYRLLDLVYDHEDLLKWCFEHGAQVSAGVEDEFRQCPLMERVVGGGTISNFKLLLAKGALIGRKTLQAAAEYAASSAAKRPERMAMLRYLVEEERLDFNRIDMEVQLPNHWGTAIAYAAMGQDGEDAVQYLLAKGAEPTVKDCWGNHDALALVKFYGNKDMICVLKVCLPEDSTRRKKGKGKEEGLGAGGGLNVGGSGFAAVTSPESCRSFP